MPSTSKQPKTPAERMAAYRRRMREQGLRPVQIWLPDTRSPAFLGRLRREAKAIAAGDPAGDEVLAWIEEIYAWPEA